MENDEEPPLVEVIKVPTISDAERVARDLRDVGIPAILDPKALRGLQDAGFRDVHGFFPVVVPRHYEPQAVEHLRGTVHGAEGDAELETILASFDEDDSETPVTGRRSLWLRREVVITVILMLGTLAALALVGLLK